MKKNIAREHTRQALVAAFWKLYGEKTIEKITVGAVAGIAGYNRSTFYEYFSDVYDVLQQEEDALLERMRFGAPDKEGLPLEEVVAMFEENADRLSLLLSEKGDFSFFFRIRSRMRDAFYDLARTNGTEPDFELQIEIEYHVAGTASSLLSWLRTPNRPSAETYLTALRNVNEYDTERLLSKLRRQQ